MLEITVEYASATATHRQAEATALLLSGEPMH